MVIASIPKMVGFIYELIMIFVIAYLWYAKKWNQKTGWLLLAISALMGFLVFAPVAPYQFQQLVCSATLITLAPRSLSALSGCRLCSCSLCYRAGFSADISAR
jgi:ferredoxin-type protein NapH